MAITRIYRFLSGTTLPEAVQLASVTERTDDQPPSCSQNTRHHLRFYRQSTSFYSSSYITHLLAVSFTQRLPQTVTHSLTQMPKQSLFYYIFLPFVELKCFLSHFHLTCQTVNGEILYNFFFA